MAHNERKRCASPRDKDCSKRARPEFTKSSLKLLYGDIRTTNPKKMAAFDSWSSAGEAMADIAKRLGVAEATIEVYIIDLLADGRGSDLLRRKMLKDLKVDRDSFWQVAREVSGSGVTLHDLKESTNLRYNQIRAVLAGLIHDTHL